MRRLGLILSVAVLAALLVSIATITAAAETETSGSTLQAASTSSQLSVSQGSVNHETLSKAERRAALRDMAEEENLPDYSQVVDNAQSRRFDAPGWKQGGSDSWAHGGDYVSAGASTADARFKLRAPTDGHYAIYAWWPGRKGDSSATRFGVKSARGTKWVVVNQTTDGGMWVKLGTYEMKAGDRYVVRIPPDRGAGAAIADAVALVRGMASSPPDDRAPAEGGPINDAIAASFENIYTVSNTSAERQALIRFGRRHLGTPYYLSPPAPCWAYHKEDCSCFTSLVFRHFDKRLPDSPIQQYWHYGRRIDRADLKRGDLVFFKENGSNHPITHVAMYSGNGYVLHASAYSAYRKVVESKMKYIRGYFGAKRIKLP